MTEEEWLTTDDTAAMFGYTSPYLSLYTRGARGMSRRVASLFTVGCVRATPLFAGRPFLPRVVAAVERAADEGDWAAVDEFHGRAYQRLRRRRPRVNSAEHH